MEKHMIPILKKFWLGVVIAFLFVAAAFLIYTKLHPGVLPDNLIQGTGRIDGDLINLNTKYPGRIAHITVEDGQNVTVNEVVAVVDSAEQKAQKIQIEAQINAQNEELNARKIELEIARGSIPQSLIKADANLALISHQRDELDQTISAQQSLLEQSERDLERTRNLDENRLIEKRQLETATLKVQTDRNMLLALEQKRKQLDEAIGIARSDRIEAAAAQQKIAALEQGIAAMKSGVKALEASKTQIEAVLEEMELRSPVNGSVVETIAHSGEVVGSGTPVATLIDPASLYLKIFVDTLQNGKIEIGDEAVIFLDASPDRPIAAKVVRIEQKAEFTPKEVSVASDRIQRVFAVHLKPLTPDPLLKLGLPAIGIISLDGKNLPVSLREVPE